MHDALGMNHYFDPIHLHPKKPVRFDHLQPFVEERRRVNRDPPPHFPGRMVQGFCHGKGSKFGFWGMQKRSARGRQPDALDFFHPPATQALMNCVVLTIDGQQRVTLAARFGRDQLSRRNQTLFIGQSDSLTRLHRFVGCFQSRYTDDRADYKVHFRMGCDAHISRRAVRNLNAGDAGRLEPGAQSVSIFFGCEREHTRLPALCLLDCSINIAARRERRDLKAFGVVFNDV